MLLCSAVCLRCKHNCRLCEYPVGKGIVAQYYVVVVQSDIDSMCEGGGEVCLVQTVLVIGTNVHKPSHYISRCNTDSTMGS